ncbi:MAG: dual specificity protein phosphatase family protein [candidate division NC10 bacterium]
MARERCEARVLAITSRPSIPCRVRRPFLRHPKLCGASLQTVMDLNQIDGYLFQGSAPLGPRDTDRLLSLGVRAAVDMRAEAQPPLLLDSTLWLPTTDGEAATVEQLTTGIRFIDHCLSLGWGVYVYCQGGIGRSTMMVAAYLVGKRGMDVDEAIEGIQRCRPGASPSRHQVRAAETAGLAFREAAQGSLST